LNYERIEAPESDYLYITASTIEGGGQGLFTAIDIYKGEIIALFKGEIITHIEAEKRKLHDYFMNLPNGAVLDCKRVKGFAKYANDAQGFIVSDKKNNAIITLNEDNEVCLVAKQKIRSGDEIFCSYGKKYWDRFRDSNSGC
jgi:hypothetical protein